MLDTVNNVLGKIDDFVWGVPLIVLILTVGIYLTIRLRGLQVIRLKKGVKLIFAKDTSVDLIRGMTSDFLLSCPVFLCYDAFIILCGV